MPEPLKEKLDCEETDQVLGLANKWADTLASAFAHRQVNPLVIDVEGKAVLMTRYIRGIMPPQELFSKIEDTSRAQAVAWFVSLIPYIPSNAYFPGLGDIWPDSGKFMQMMSGTETEHAILLTNYFTAMNKTAYLVLGHGVPEGRTAYVLTFEENGEHWLWNGVTGEHFVTTETFCPLSCVHALVNSCNMWANLQAAEAPGRLRWDLGNTADWWPMFPGGVAPAPLTSLQPDQVHLAQADHRAAKNLKDKIEKTLRDTIMNLRKRMSLRTSLNFQGKSVLTKLLPGLEAARVTNSGHGRGLTQEHLSELQRIMASHKVPSYSFIRRVLHLAPQTTKAIINWDIGMMPMKWRIAGKKLQFVRKIMMKEDDNITKKALHQEVITGIKGLAHECKELTNELEMPNIMLGNTPKALIKRTIAKKVHIEFWNAMENSKKVRDRLTFNPADNTYIKCLSLPLTRVWFRYRARAIPKVKGNYKQSHSDLSCTLCSSNLEMNQEHLETCEGTEHERRGLDMGTWRGLLDFWRRMIKKLGATAT